MAVLLNSPWFELHHVRLTGAKRLTVDDVLEVAQFQKGASLFSLDLVQGEKRIETHPLVATVSLKRSLPGTLTVSLVERRPVGWLGTSQGFWAIDKDAIPLYFSYDLSLTLPVITVDPPVTPVPGVSLTDFRLAESLSFARSLTVSGIASISEIHADGDGLVAYTHNGVTVSLGRQGDMPQKAKVFERILKDIEAGNISVVHIDLRHPQSPAIRNRR